MSTTPNAPTAMEFPTISPQAEIEALRSMNTRQVEIIGELEAELSNVSAAIGTVEFMDLPDGGDVSLSEQVRRMRAALLAARREVTVAPLPTEILAIRAARDFCADHAMSGMAVTLIDEYIARCRAALAATQEEK